MYCGKCGTKLPEGAVFCPNCGNQARAAAARTASHRPAGYKNEAARHRVIGVIAVLLAASVLCSLCFFLFAGRSYEAPIKGFFDAFMEADGDAFLDLMPPGRVDYLCRAGGKTKKEVAAEMSETVSEALVWIKGLYKDCTIEYEIVDVVEYSESQLDRLKREGEAYDVNIKDGLDVEVEYYLCSDGMRISGESTTFTMAKVRGKWYIWDEEVI